MAFRLEVRQFDCRANMPTRYKRDLRCRTCGPEVREQEEREQESEQNENDQEEQEQESEQSENEQEEQVQNEWKTEDQEHLDICPGHSELWEGLGPSNEQSRVKYFMRLKLK